MGALVFLVACSGGQAKTSARASQSLERAHARHRGPVGWTRVGVPEEAIITGGPWTLEQGAAGAGRPSAGYCVDGVRQSNPSSERMQPYYFPFVMRRGSQLLGYFDWRPKDDNEAIVAASSDDGGRSWVFEQQALEMTAACPKSDADQLGSDDGLGHPYVLSVGGVTRLYTLDRSADHVDSAGLVVHALAGGGPLDGAPSALDVPQRTSGLIDPDGIIDVVPGVAPTTVLYLQKQLGGDVALAPGQRCPGAKANHDVATPRLAQTEDGVSFTDLGPVSGLNDAGDVSATGTRYIGPRGAIVALEGGRFGLFFSGGSCIDADSDAFHYLGYAESSDLSSWTVSNGMTNPIASISATTVDGVTIPLTPAVAGPTQGWFAGRVYGPTAVRSGPRTLTLLFAGYHTAKPKDAFGDYRTIGRLVLRASHGLEAADLDGDGD
jgi:hypothetical protein